MCCIPPASFINHPGEHSTFPECKSPWKQALDQHRLRLLREKKAREEREELPSTSPLSEEDHEDSTRNGKFAEGTTNDESASDEENRVNRENRSQNGKNKKSKRCSPCSYCTCCTALPIASVPSAEKDIEGINKGHASSDEETCTGGSHCTHNHMPCRNCTEDHSCSYESEDDKDEKASVSSGSNGRDNNEEDDGFNGRRGFKDNAEVDMKLAFEESNKLKTVQESIKESAAVVTSDAYAETYATASSPVRSTSSLSSEREDSESEELEMNCDALFVSCRTLKETEMYKTSKLIVRQNAIRSRMIGFGSKDRRPLDPAPVVQLVTPVADHVYNDNSRFVCHASLWSADKTKNLSYVLNPAVAAVTRACDLEASHFTQTMTGSVSVSCNVARDMTSEKGMYFVFSDLCVRIPGEFCLKFNVYDVSGRWNQGSSSSSGSSKELVYSTFSSVFTVYHPKEFPGMSKTTDLSKCLAPQSSRAHGGGYFMNSNEEEYEVEKSKSTVVSRFSKRPHSHGESPRYSSDNASSSLSSDDSSGDAVVKKQRC